MPELWVQAKACRIYVAVGVLPALLDDGSHSRLQAFGQRTVPYVIIEKIEIKVDLQQKVSASEIMWSGCLTKLTAYV